MELVKRFWATLTYVIGPLSMSPVNDLTPAQVPLIGNHDLSVQHVGKSPIFNPPGNEPDNNFRCDYTAMKDWLPCTSPGNRHCWLRHKNGTEFNIHTDYETLTPTGVLRQYELDIYNGSINADGLNFTEGKFFNKQYPGPWLQACWADTVEITVRNHLPYDGTSIHWHGIRQKDTMHMDGVNGVTQCPIARGDSMVYRWHALQYGSSWYHSHFSMQYADGLVGPLTIHGPSSGHWDEPADSPLLMTDWGLNSGFAAIYVGLSNASVLLKRCGNVTRYRNVTDGVRDIPEPYTIKFDYVKTGAQRAKRYLLRLINTSFDTTFVFTIDNHKLRIIGSDFVPVHPYSNYSVLVGIGQRYHVVVEADPINSPIDDWNFWIRTYEANCFLKGANKFPLYERTGILRYSNSSKNRDPDTQPWPKSLVSTDCSDETYKSLRPVLEWQVGDPTNGLVGQEWDVTFRSGCEDVFPMAKFNFESPESPGFKPLRIDYDDPTFLNLNNTLPWKERWMIVPANYTADAWVYLALLAFVSPTNAHPIHLHGHDFAILQQEENMNFSISALKLKLDNPPRRDVVLLPTAGFVVIAFKADNPGSWLLHCHIAFHASFGLVLQILERQEAADALWPFQTSPAVKEANRVCDNWKKWQSNCTNWWPVDGKTPGSSCAGGINQFQDDSGI